MAGSFISLKKLARRVPAFLFEGVRNGLLCVEDGLATGAGDSGAAGRAGVFIGVVQGELDGAEEEIINFDGVASGCCGSSSWEIKIERVKAKEMVQTGII